MPAKARSRSLPASSRESHGLRKRSWERLEAWLVYLITLHSLAVGVMLLGAPNWAVSFGGWDGVETTFFVRQAGAFHFVVAFAYLYEYLRFRSVTILVVTKGLALVFLLAIWACGEQAWSVPFSGLADGAMGAVTWVAHRRAQIRDGG